MQWTGWNDEQRRRCLPLVANNSHFLLLQLVEILLSIRDGIATLIVFLMECSLRTVRDAGTEG